jgi:hypothetical protein
LFVLAAVLLARLLWRGVVAVSGRLQRRSG